MSEGTRIFKINRRFSEVTVGFRALLLCKSVPKNFREFNCPKWNINSIQEVFQFSISFDPVAEIYDKTRSLPGEVMKKLVATLVLELGAYHKILEVGVGTGRFAEPLQRAGFDVFGIDISGKMADKAKKKGVRQLLLADARFLPFKPDSFDATISVHVLHLISEWRKALQEICRVTRYSMFSVGDAKRDPVREAYDRLLKDFGHERHHPGKSEQQLNELFCPARKVFVTCYEINADESLMKLEKRTSSSQWTIPEDVNSKAVGELKKEFAGKSFKQELYLLIWKMEPLKAYCNTQNITENPDAICK